MATGGIDTVILPLAGGFGIGAAIGYFVRKVVKILLFSTGAVLGIILYMQTQGWLSVNWDKIAASTQGVMNRLVSAETGGSIQTAIGNLGIPLTSGMMAGMIFGFSRG